jgi:uncharacterized protein YdeI (YjbR/CyaY-like superfamily)
VLLRAGLDEQFKWRKPCYMHGGSNMRLEFRAVADVTTARRIIAALVQDAWARLTPGRLLQFSGAKQSKIRVARIECATPRILEGFGMHDQTS